MDAEAEPEVVVGGPGDVEPLRSVELLGVVVARRQEQHGEVPGGELDAAELAGLGEGPAGELDRGDVTQHLLHAAADDRRVAAEALELVGMLQQSQRPARDEVDRRLVPGHQQQDAGREQLGLAQHGAPVLGPHQPAEQVLPRVAPALGQDLEEVLGELEHRLAPGGDDLLGEQEVGIEPPGQRVGPLLEPVVVLDRHPEQVTDHPDGQRVGERLEQIDPVGLQGRVQQLVDGLLGPLPQRLHHLGGEGLGHQPPQPGVVGRVPEEERPHLQHGRRHRVVLGHRGPEALGHPLDRHVEAVRAGPPVPQDGQAVLMASHHPEAQVVPVDGRPLPQFGVEGEGIAGPQGVEGVEDRP